MNRNDLVQITKLLQIIVEREVQKNTKNVLSEIRKLNSQISLLKETTQPKTKIVKQQSNNESIKDILSEINVSEKVKPNSFLQDIFETVTPFDDDSEQVESVLDLKTSSTDPAAKILNKLQTTDFRKKLQIMEQSANNFNRSQMHK